MMAFIAGLVIGAITCFVLAVLGCMEDWGEDA